MNRIFGIYLIGVTLSGATLFDIQTIGAPSGQFALSPATGTSNGVAWRLESIAPVQTVSYIPFTTTNGTFNGFTGSRFTPALPNTDRLHLGNSFKLTFGEAISSILFYVRENAGNANLDFGIVPVLVSGEVAINGTKFAPSTNGGIVRLQGLNTTMLQHTNSVADGLDMAFVVEQLAPKVPEPLSLWLAGSALAGIWAARRLRTR